MKTKFIVELDVPERSSADFVASYVQHAIKSGIRYLDSGDPMRDLNGASVKVAISHRKEGV